MTENGKPMGGALFYTWRTLMGISQDDAAIDTGVDRDTIQQWEDGNLPISPRGEAYVHAKWAKFLDLLGDTIQGVEELHSQQETPPKYVSLGLYRSADAFARTYPDSDLTWGEHSARVRTLALLLELSDYPVKIYWIKEE